MTQPNGKIAEQLWLRAHEHIRRGNLAQAVRDLAKSFEILKALSDPRLRQVHEKWVSVHKLYKEEKAQGGGHAGAADAKTLQAQAETAANNGDLPRAITLYQRILGNQPQNELARERLNELKLAQERERQLAQKAAVARKPAVVLPAQPSPQSVIEQNFGAPAAVAQSVPVAATPRPEGGDKVMYLESLLERIASRKRAG